MQHTARQPRRPAGPVERVDPYEYVEEDRGPGVVQPAREAERVRLRELRSRIDELDAEVASLMARRTQLTRSAFELAGAGEDGGLLMHRGSD